MSQIDLFEDSQTLSDVQEDPDDHAIEERQSEEPCEVVLPRLASRKDTTTDQLARLNKEVQQIQKTQTEILDLLQQLVSGGANFRTSAVFHVETSEIKAPLTVYLKGKFVRFPWLNETDPEIKAKIVKMLKDGGYGADENNVLKCFSFALHLYTNWRNMIRQKLFNSEKATSKMAISSLQDYLFSSFKGAGLKGEALQENRHLTIALRAYADKINGFSNGSVGQDFWKKFQRSFDPTMSKSDFYQLESKMNKKIEEKK